MVLSTEQIAQLALAPGPSRWNKSSCRILKKTKNKNKVCSLYQNKKNKKEEEEEVTSSNLYFVTKEKSLIIH